MFLVSRYFFVSLSLITLSLSVIPNKFVQISLALIFIIYFLFKQGLSKNVISKTLIVAIYLILIFLSQIFISDFIEFLKSFSLTILFFIIFFSIQKIVFFKSVELKNAIIFSVILIISFEIIQLIEVLVFNSRTTYFLLDQYSISTATDAGRFESANFLGFLRPVSFFHEPSYLGSVLFICLISLKNLNSNLLFRLLTIFGIILSLSTLNYLFLLLYFTFSLKKKYYPAAFIIISPFLVYYASFFFNFFRFSEIFQEGTSGWARLVKPYIEVLKELNENWAYFGRAIGNNKVIHDNSFFLIISYTGFLFPFFFYYIYNYSKKIIIKDKFIILGLLNLIFLNGAIFTPESTFLVMILISSFNLKINLKENYNKPL
tara:strand:- start:2260 stop:3381 length:1122 start_codon:yes stop_codon:yes gene_type:complete